MALISIIVPNYNHGRYLPHRLQSIFKQRFCDFELICLDDASQDDSQEILHRMIAKQAARVLINDVNSGSPFSQWNKGAELAQGEYLWFAESDDYAEPEFLETLVPVLQRHPGVGLVYCRSKLVGEDDSSMGINDEWTRDLDPTLWYHDFVMDGREFARRFLVHRNVLLNASAVLVRKKHWDAVGPASASLRLCGDWLQWAKILAVSDVAYIASPLNAYRVHRETQRSRFHRSFAEVSEYYRVVCFIMKRFDVTRSVRNRCFHQLCSSWLDQIALRNAHSPWRRLWQILVKGAVLWGYDRSIPFRISRWLVRGGVRGMQRSTKFAN